MRRAQLVRAGLAALAVACATTAGDDSAPLVDCAMTGAKLEYDHDHLVRMQQDSNGDGRIDRTFHYEGDQLRRVELDTDFDGTTDFEVQFDERSAPFSWTRASAPAASAAPLAQAPRELARILPSLEPPPPEDCLARREVSDYLSELRIRMYSRWRPSGAGQAELRFSLAASGAVTSACLVSANDRSFGASAIHALFGSSPFGTMPERVTCIADHPLVGNFAAN
jgi:hypothetical protein